MHKNIHKNCWQYKIRLINTTEQVSKIHTRTNLPANSFKWCTETYTKKQFKHIPKLLRWTHVYTNVATYIRLTHKVVYAAVHVYPNQLKHARNIHKEFHNSFMNSVFLSTGCSAYHRLTERCFGSNLNTQNLMNTRYMNGGQWMLPKVNSA